MAESKIVNVLDLKGTTYLRVTGVTINSEASKEIKGWAALLNHIVLYAYNHSKDIFWDKAPNWHYGDRLAQTQIDERYKDKLADNLYFYNKHSGPDAIQSIQDIAKSLNYTILLNVQSRWEKLSEFNTTDQTFPSKIKIYNRETACNDWGSLLKVFFTDNNIPDTKSSKDFLSIFPEIFSPIAKSSSYEQIFSDPVYYINKDITALQAVDCLKESCKRLNIPEDEIEILPEDTEKKRPSSSTKKNSENNIDNTSNNEDDTSSEHEFTDNYNQIIYYGVPGSGKSNKIDKETEAADESQLVRVVFHPDYCNSDFIGQILPKRKNSSISYEFTPGPFSRLLWRAYHNPSTKYYLVIEEINRGNAAAIFGDLFQLLDRITSEKDISDTHKEYKTGWSKYSVTNESLNNYLRSYYEYGTENYEEDHHNANYKVTSEITVTPYSGIRLPPNFSILATMNTSDQNVFTLDNAFQRRWDMKLISNKLKETDDQYKLNIHCKLQNEDCCWGKLRDIVNGYITGMNNSISSMDDCQLGAYFITPKADCNHVSAEDFACKVIKYLWDDVFRLDRESVFKKKGSFETAVLDEIKDDCLKLEDIFKKDFLNIKSDEDAEED